MPFHSEFNQYFVDDFSKLDASWQKRVLRAIEEKILLRPMVFSKPLTESLRGVRQHRVGDYRVFFVLRSKTIHFVGVLHRSIAHKIMAKRKRQ